MESKQLCYHLHLQFIFTLIHRQTPSFKMGCFITRHLMMKMWCFIKLNEWIFLMIKMWCFITLHLMIKMRCFITLNLMIKMVFFYNTVFSHKKLRPRLALANKNDLWCILSCFCKSYSIVIIRNLYLLVIYIRSRYWSEYIVCTMFGMCIYGGCAYLVETFTVEIDVTCTGTDVCTDVLRIRSIWL